MEVLGLIWAIWAPKPPYFTSTMSVFDGLKTVKRLFFHFAIKQWKKSFKCIILQHQRTRCGFSKGLLHISRGSNHMAFLRHADTNIVTVKVQGVGRPHAGKNMRHRGGIRISKNVALVYLAPRRRFGMFERLEICGPSLKSFVNGWFLNFFW